VTVKAADRAGTVVLVCDRCGLELANAAIDLRDWYVLWSIVRGGGWRGTPELYGPHTCPDCSASPGPHGVDETT
jgi:hypothetical protein